MTQRRMLSPAYPGDSAYLYMDQAGPTVGHWLRQSVDEIDATFGDGYAKKNPALVAAFIQAAAMDQLTAHLANTIKEPVAEIALALDRLASAVSETGSGR